MSVSEILSGKGGNVITVSPGTSLEDVAGTLAKHKIGALVAVAGSRAGP